MQDRPGFYTLKGYTLQQTNPLSTAVEDYLEMLARLAPENGGVRVSVLSKMLHVKMSSASKMVHQLVQEGYATAARYGEIFLTPQGEALGQYLLYRHDVVHDFLCAVNGSENELEQAEKIEHFLDERTVHNLQKAIQKLR